MKEKKKELTTNWALQNFHVSFHQLQPLDTSFSLIGIDASVANAFRRILLAEIPTLAIEQVYIFNNTSLVQDEVLAHRLGLVPLQGDKDGLRWLRWFKRATEDDPRGDTPSDYNTIILHLDVECSWQEGGMEMYKKGETDPKKLYHNSSGEFDTPVLFKNTWTFSSFGLIHCSTILFPCSMTTLLSVLMRYQT